MSSYRVSLGLLIGHVPWSLCGAESVSPCLCGEEGIFPCDAQVLRLLVGGGAVSDLAEVISVIVLVVSGAVGTGGS